MDETLVLFKSLVSSPDSKLRTLGEKMEDMLLFILDHHFYYHQMEPCCNPITITELEHIDDGQDL